VHTWLPLLQQPLLLLLLLAVFLTAEGTGLAAG
jgi:hypothetical protein